MQIGLKISPRLIQTLKPTLQQLQYYRLLQQTNLELELDIHEEVSQNPALEIEEIRTCGKCGEIVLEGHPCMTCISRKVEDADREKIQTEKLDMMEEIYSSTQGQYEASTYEAGADDDLPDTFATVVKSVTLEDHLKRRLLLDYNDLSEEDRLLAEEIIDRIDTDGESVPEDDDNVDQAIAKRARVDNPGLVRASDAVLAEELNTDADRVRRLRRRIAEIDPVGSSLESSIEVLAFQAEICEELDPEERPILATIIRSYLPDITKEHYARVGKKVGISAKRVKELIDFMRNNFHIHPRRKFEQDESNAYTDNPHISADVRIREVNGAYLVEVLDSGLPQLKINKFYLDSYRKLKANRNAFNPEERKHIKEYFERASSYMENLNSRRSTMLEITEEIVKQQEEYLRKGPLYLKKLTRKQVAESIGVHPSTVSRALAVRYCWLPDNSIVSFNVFFNPSACYIEMIRQILKDETPLKVFSDDEIRDIMVEKGHDLSRRVITKYRKKGRIPPSGRRRRALINEAIEHAEELEARYLETGDESLKPYRLSDLKADDLDMDDEDDESGDDKDEDEDVKDEAEDDSDSE